MEKAGGAGANRGATGNPGRHRRGNSGICISVLVNVDGAFCAFYYPYRFRDIFEFGDFEKFSALSTPYSSVGGVFAEQPVVRTSRAVGNNLHIADSVAKEHNDAMYFRQKERVHPL
jgi:hypothetical protein